MIISGINTQLSSQISNPSNIDLVNQMRSMSIQASGGINTKNGGSIPFKDVLDSVAAAQNKSSDLARRFVEGDKNVSMADVLSASQNSSIKFEALRVSRNKMLEVTKEILNTQI
ncbi:flagellar hook-basal body complex protein FliE [Photobacterium damselae]|uniref:flagellar hook-basal body complex protein FliE n=1 Tax=Photobacterium damselae TaxID=38293 RepID=UPI001F4455B1|nr:flagellar hook-basal body complex protein FliE [Photobacterium damselae]UKA04613.1 flagellar hook-basal body complex protein FliE [Photobacterium damselae subsp. damselae]